jgi:hypothetical protein
MIVKLQFVTPQSCVPRLLFHTAPFWNNLVNNLFSELGLHAPD